MSGMPGSTGDLHGSPQAVFTSFKLPKPGGSTPGEPSPGATAPPGVIPPGPGSPITSNPGFGSRLFPLGLGNPPNNPTNHVQTTPPKINAPLGGLPALADQLLMQQSQNKANLSNNIAEESESNNNKSPREGSGSPPGTPPPGKRKLDDVDGESDVEGTPPKNQGLIKAKGTYYPLTAFPTSMPQGPVMRQGGESPPRIETTSSGKNNLCSF